MKNPLHQPDIMKRKLLALLGTLPWLGACESTYSREIRQAYEARQRAAYEALSPEEKRLDNQLRQKFKGIYGGVLRTDALGDSKEYVTMYTQSGQMWRSALHISKGTGHSTFTDAMYIPRTLRVVWRAGDVRGKPNARGSEDGTNLGWEGGTIVGDYTVPVAERIPDSLLDYIRQNGGALRLKIRLVDDGVLIGWDVEHVIPLKDWKPNSLGLGSGVSYRLPGGDFKEARPAQSYWDGQRYNPFPNSVALPLSAEDQALLDKHDLMVVGKEGGIWTDPPTPPNYRRLWEKGWYIDKKTGQKVWTTY